MKEESPILKYDKKSETAATIASELHKAIKVAEEISLASNNAGVLAVRAGTEAAGFGALAEFLDQTARKTIQASNNINQQAIEMSRLTSDIANAESSLSDAEKETALGDENAETATLNANSKENELKTKVSVEKADIDGKTKKLLRDLEDLKQELDVARVLASMSLVEAAQAGKEFSGQLTDNAKNIAKAIEKIDAHVCRSLSLIGKS